MVIARADGQGGTVQARLCFSIAEGAVKSPTVQPVLALLRHRIAVSKADVHL